MSYIMADERLVEITSMIIKLDGPLWTMGYVTSLSDEEIYLLFKNIRTSKYSNLNVCEAMHAFAYDYLISKGFSVSSPSIEMIRRKMLCNNDSQVLDYVDVLMGKKRV